VNFFCFHYSYILKAMDFRVKNKIASSVRFVSLGGDQNLIISSNLH
jgi:hypothetical protein